MEITLRKYQQEMIDTAFASLKQDKFVLIQGSTGCGKTIVFSGLTKRLISQYPRMRIAILAHRLELVEQAKDKLLKVWFDAPIGIACASAKGKMDTDMPITIGSIQTLANHAATTAPFHLIIIDEVHMLPPITTASQYKNWLETMQIYNPTVRVLGMTATPFRLGHGYIYGDKCKKGAKNWFNNLNCKIGIRELQKQGYLCGYRAKAIVDIGNDLKGIKTTGGEYNLSDLSDLMSNITHVGSAVKAFQEYGEGRKHVVVFAVTIEHAETLNSAFKAAGYTSAIVHSKMPMAQRKMALDLFENGQVQFIFNVGILTVGWDSPITDCLILCRPTKSPALYVQVCGRGLRIAEGKKDVLILDLANNCKMHGDPADPIVEIPQVKTTEKPPQKHCPKCKEIMHAASTECPACGFRFEVEKKEEFNGKVQMQTVDFKAKPKEKPFLFNVDDGGLEKYTSKAGNTMIKVWIVDQTNFVTPKYVNEFWQFDVDAHEFARKKAFQAWHTLTHNRPPLSTTEALQRQSEILINLPDKIEVIKDGEYLKVNRWRPNGYVQKPTTIIKKELIEEEIPF